MAPDELYREQASLLEPEIEFHVDPVEEFDLDDNSVKTKSGKTYGYDTLVIATGSRAAPETIPGLAENSVNCYTEKNALEMLRQVREFKGGKVGIVVGVPHKCPMIPLEVTFVLHDYFKDKGIADKTEFHYTYPIGRLHSLEPVAKWAEGEFAKLGIKTTTLFNMKEVDGNGKVVHSEEGETLDCDLLVSVPPHKGMEVIEKNKLGAGGFIPTDRHSLKMEGRDNVYVDRRHDQPADFQGRLDRPFRGRGGGREPRRDDQARASRCATTTARCSASSRPARTAPPTPCSTTATRRHPRRRTRRCTGSRWPTTSSTGRRRADCSKGDGHD